MPRSLLTTIVASASPLDVLGDDQQRPAGLRDQLQERQEVLHRADLLLVDENDRILEHDFHALGIGHEVRRQVAAVELHPFDDLERRVERLRLFDRDHAVLADFVHRVGDDLTDGLVVVRRDRADLGDHRAAHGLRHHRQFGRDRGDGLLDTALDRHRVGAGGDVLRAVAVNRLRQDGRRGGAVAGDIGRLARDFLHHLGAHVLERVLQVDFLRDRDAVLGDRGRTV